MTTEECEALLATASLQEHGLRIDTNDAYRLRERLRNVRNQAQREGLHTDYEDLQFYIPLSGSELLIIRKSALPNETES